MSLAPRPDRAPAVVSNLRVCRDDLVERLVDYEMPKGGWGSGSGSGSGKKKKKGGGGGGMDLWGDNGSDSDDEDDEDETNYDGMAYAAVKALCQDRGLSPHGSRTALVQRLQENASGKGTLSKTMTTKALSPKEKKDRKKVRQKLEAKYEDMRSSELKRECRKLQVNPNGSDSTLIDRLVEHQMPKEEVKIVEHDPCAPATCAARVHHTPARRPLLTRSCA
eukprot:COSAG04_NODE_244_length_18980_cov_6.382501_6_plen_221_part_00